MSRWRHNAPSSPFWCEHPPEHILGRGFSGCLLIRNDVEQDCRMGVSGAGAGTWMHLRFIYRLGVHLNDWLGGRDTDQFLRET